MKVAFIADVHSNLEALEAVLKAIDKLKIKKIFCLGDVIGYASEPNKCLEIIKKRKIPCCIGNHELAVIDQNVLGFNVYATEAIEWTISKITKENLDFIKSFPEKIKSVLDDINILMVHGSPLDPINDYVFPDYPLERIVDAIDSEVVSMGHTHVPFIKEVKGCSMINCGSVGQPRDHNPDACYVVFNIENKNARVFRVKYDVKTTVEKIIDSGLPPFLAQRLFLGI
jgi:putative phosphoesterase